MAEQEKEVEILKRDCEKTEDLAAEHAQNVNLVKKELEKEQSESRKMAKVLEIGKEKVEEIKNQIEKFRVLEEEFVSSKSKNPRFRIKNVNLNVVRDQIFALTGLKNSYLHDINNLKMQTKELKSAQSCISF